MQLTVERLQARDRWQSRWNLPLILAALLPLLITSPDTRWVEVVGARPPALLLSAVGARGHRRRG